MKLFQKNLEGLIFHLPPREKDLLLFILERYPALPGNWSGTPVEKAGEAVNLDFLRETLQEFQKSNKTKLQKFLEADTHFTENEDKVALSVTFAEVEWLLQILNEIRVGCWHALGCPDEAVTLAPDETDVVLLQAFWGLQIAGHFQHDLLRALGSEEDSAEKA